MSARQRLANDSYLAGLKRRSELALEWFDAVAKVLQGDIDAFKSQPGPTANYRGSADPGNSHAKKAAV
jgi:hypothetical protein